MSQNVPNLAGKDYFTESEAAEYACVSRSHFRAKAAEYGIPVGKDWMGKNVYRRADIQAAIERGATWQLSTGADGRGISSGVKVADSIGNRSALSRIPKPNARGRSRRQS